MARSTLPAVTQEMECSPERPPKTTATRGLRVARSWSVSWALMVPRPYPSRRASSRTPSLVWGYVVPAPLRLTERPSAVPTGDGRGHLRPAAARAGQPAEPAADDGVDVRRGRGHRVRPLRQPHVVGLRVRPGGPGGRAVPRLRDRP